MNCEPHFGHPAWLAAVALLTLACSGGGGASNELEQVAPPPNFAFDLTSEVNFGLTVTLDGAPVEGVTVQVATARQVPEGDETFEDDMVGGLFYLGATDSGGRIEQSLSIPTEFEEVDVIVHLPGTSGPYTDLALKTFLGPSAPSSRRTINRVSLSNLSVALTTEP